MGISDNSEKNWHDCFKIGRVQKNKTFRSVQEHYAPPPMSDREENVKNVLISIFQYLKISIYWDIEILRYWNDEILKHQIIWYWNIETLRYWVIKMMRIWNIEN